MNDLPLYARRPLWKPFLVFLLPMILSNVLQSLQGTVNNVYLGRLLGVEALAAAASFFPVLFFFISIVMGFGSGAVVVVGQAFGAKDPVKVKAVIGTILSLAVLMGLLVAVFGGLLSRPIMVMMGTPENILAGSIQYGSVILMASPLLFLFLMSTIIMRGVGDTMTPLIALVVSSVLGLIATPALILGWGGLPHLGLMSAAYAGIFSWILTLVWLGFFLRRKNHPLAPDAMLMRHLRVDWTILKAVLRLGVPTAVQMVLISMAEAAVLTFVNAYGSNATAAYGTVNQVVSYIQFPALSVSITATIFAAQAIGAGAVDRLGPITCTALTMNLLLTGSLVIVAYLFSRTLIGFFITDAAVIDLAQRLLHITLWSYIVFGASASVAGVMRASGTVIPPMLISVSSILGIEVLTAYILSARIGIEGIWIAYPVAFTAMLTMQSMYYLLVWRKKTIRRLI